MPITNQFFVRTTVALLLLGLLALVGIVGTSIWLVERTQGYFNEVVEARDARAATVDLRNALQVAEGSQRGFLLTGQQSYLEPYDVAIKQIMPQFERLSAILKPYPEADEAVEHLKQSLDQKLAEMARTIQLKRAGDDAGAVAIVNTNVGKELTEEAQNFFTALIRAADERLTTGVNDQRNSATALRWTTLIGAVVILIVVGGSAITVLRYTKELAQAREEVAAVNAGLEERVRERTADLGRANEEIQRFAYIVTHDLRAPLVNIMGFTSELETSIGTLQSFVGELQSKDETQVPTEVKQVATEDLPEAIGFIRSSTKKMDGLINAILKLSREGRRTLRPETVKLEPLLQNSADAIQHQVADAGGEITLDLQVPTLTTDKLSLEQTFGNLLDNAVKYRSPDRPLRIHVRGRQASGNRIIIEVEDNGRGIAKQDNERVFELFRRSGSQDQPGEGIGLAYVRTVVRNLGGDVTLDSELGKGTTFRVSLPRDLRSVIGSTKT